MRNFIVETIGVCETPASQTPREITVLEAIRTAVDNYRGKVTSKWIIDCFPKSYVIAHRVWRRRIAGAIPESLDTNVENWILIHQDSPTTFKAFSDKDMQKKKKKNINDDDNDGETNAESLKKNQELFWKS